MKIRKFDYKSNLGLILVVFGLVLWLIPFVVVAIDNAIGATQPADTFISNFGFFVLTASPVLVLAGLLLTALRFIKR